MLGINNTSSAADYALSGLPAYAVRRALERPGDTTYDKWRKKFEIEIDASGYGSMVSEVSIRIKEYDRPIRKGVASSTIDPEVVNSDTLEDEIDKAIQRESRAFADMLSDLMQSKAGSFVAVLNGGVIDHDRDEFALAKRICRGYPDRVVLIRQVTREKPPVYLFESPEAVGS